VLKTESEHQYNRKLVLKTESEHQYNRKLVLKTESVFSTSFLLY
jgi:hypothetical protein